MIAVRISLLALASASIALLATACAFHSGSAVPDALVPSTPALSTWAAPRDLHGLRSPLFLYVTENSPASYPAVVRVYPARSKNNPPPVATITKDLYGVDGMCTDSAENLYVPSGPSAVTVFPKGSDIPSKTYTVGLSSPYTCVVDSNSNFFVNNFDPNSANGTIVEYPKGNEKHALSYKITLGTPVAIALDQKNNIYFTAVGTKNIWRFSPSGDKALPYVLPDPYASLGGLAFDAQGRLFVGDTNNNAIYGFSGKSSKPFETITQGLNSPGVFAFAPDGFLYVPNSRGNNVTVYAPNSTKVVATYSNDMQTPNGVAFLPVK